MMIGHCVGCTACAACNCFTMSVSQCMQLTVHMLRALCRTPQDLCAWHSMPASYVLLRRACSVCMWGGGEAQGGCCPRSWKGCAGDVAKSKEKKKKKKKFKLIKKRQKIETKAMHICPHAGVDGSGFTYWWFDLCEDVEDGLNFGQVLARESPPSSAPPPPPARCEAAMNK